MPRARKRARAKTEAGRDRLTPLHNFVVVVVGKRQTSSYHTNNPFMTGCATQTVDIDELVSEPVSQSRWHVVIPYGTCPTLLMCVLPTLVGMTDKRAQQDRVCAADVTESSVLPYSLQTHGGHRVCCLLPTPCHLRRHSSIKQLLRQYDLQKSLFRMPIELGNEPNSFWSCVLFFMDDSCI